MKNNNLNSDLLSDLELLDNFISYLSCLCPCLPFKRLQHHCFGAMASIFELSFYLKSEKLTDYGNNKK